ncbi:MAG: hypothetical protein OEV85_09930 [Candidatus Thorarchaeota archaeon]|nr:hypothetical protein [Candidatus Thorarchaeota archaeon]
MEASLRDMLRHGRKFERMRTDEPGVFIRKIPQYKNEPAYLAVEINPIDKNGLPMNKIGVIIRNQNELDAIRAILSQKKVDEVLQAIENVSQQKADKRDEE